LKNVVISYATDGRENYTNGLSRLARSFHDQAPKWDVILVAPDLADYPRGWKDYNSAHDRDIVNCPRHQQMKYGFKPYLVRAMLDRGYDVVMWADCTITVQSCPDSLAETAWTDGLVIFDNPGCPELFWTDDPCLEMLGIAEADAMFTQCYACSFIVSGPKGKEIMEEHWKLAMRGAFNEGKRPTTRSTFRAHRHDQSCLSGLAWKRGIKNMPYGPLCYYHDREKFKDTCVITNQGLTQV
jgi:hypothetical protein